MLFDAYLMVDWSAAAKPKRGPDSIWIGHLTREGRALAEAQPENSETRERAASRVRELLRDWVQRGLHVLVGFDFPYGYPRGLAAALGAGGAVPGWRFVWDSLVETIREDARNHNNRFEVASGLNARLGAGPGPFWMCPESRA